MPRMTAADAVIRELASRQSGVVERGQLLNAGLSPDAIKRRRSSGDLIGVHSGVYAVGHASLSIEARRCAALLSLEPVGALSHLTAADLWRISRIRPTEVDVTYPGGRRELQGVCVHRTRSLPSYEVVERDGLRRTTVSRTIVDLADVLTPWQLTNVCNEAAFRRKLRLESVEAIARRLRRRRGRGTLARALAMYRAGSAGTKSMAEDRYLEAILGEGVPEPLVNVILDLGHDRFELDFHWPELRLNIEIDGSGHGTPRRQERDREHDVALTAAGWLVHRFPADLVFDFPDHVVERTCAKHEERSACIVR